MTTTDDGAPYSWRPSFELILEESRRSIDRQSERVQHVRERAVGLVGFGALVAAALGLGEDGKPLGAPGIIGLGAFVVVAATSLIVLFPRKFRFELSVTKMNAWFDHPNLASVDQMVQSTAAAHEENHRYNYRKLQQLYSWIMLGVFALAVETVALVVRLMV